MKSILFVLLATMSVGQAYAFPIHQKMTDAEALATFSQNADSYNFSGIIKLSNCSGALVKFENSKDTDQAMILSNGHCVQVSENSHGMIEPNQFLSHRSANRSVTFLKPDGSLGGIFSHRTASTTEVIYATMTGTDISLYALNITYAEALSKFGVFPLVLDSQHPSEGTAINVLSGYFSKGYSCKMDQFIYLLREAGYEMNDSIRYVKDSGCQPIHGTSGSPMVSVETGKIVGINNTGNDSGEKCTMDNPCEVNRAGDIYAEQGLSYGQETYQIYTCVTDEGKIDLTKEGCALYHN